MIKKSAILRLNHPILKEKYILWLFLLIPTLLLGCGSSNNFANPGNTPVTTVQDNDLRTPSLNDDVYFKGDILTLVNKSRVVSKPSVFGPKSNRSCFDEIYKESVKKFKNHALVNDTEYFEFTAKGDNAGIEKTFEVGISLEQFKNIDLESMKKFDEFASYLDSTTLYLLKERSGGNYLLMVGHDRTTSGYGHLQSSHLLLPLQEKKPLLEFDSVTRDPRKVWFNNIGEISYLTIDTKEHGAVKDAEKTEIPLIVTLYAETSKKGKLAEFEFVCRNLNETYDQ